MPCKTGRSSGSVTGSGTGAGAGGTTTAGTEEILYQSITSEVNNRTHVTTPGSEVTDLPFLLDPTSGTLTYGAPVPEPSTYALLAGAGMLALAFRNKLVRKQA